MGPNERDHVRMYREGEREREREREREIYRGVYIYIKP